MGGKLLLNIGDFLEGRCSIFSQILGIFKGEGEISLKSGISGGRGESLLNIWDFKGAGGELLILSSHL